MRRREWSDGRWTSSPVTTSTDGDDLLVEAVEGSDAWRTTSYGFVRDTAHGLLTDLGSVGAVEVVFTLDFGAQFDQAGLLVRCDAETWVKAGVEFADGVPQVGAVVTRGASDWSVAEVPDWSGRRIRVRASRSDDALTIRAGIDGEPLRLVRLAPFPQGRPAQAGPFLASPTRAGLVVRFHEWSTGEADERLH